MFAVSPIIQIELMTPTLITFANPTNGFSMWLQCTAVDMMVSLCYFLLHFEKDLQSECVSCSTHTFRSITKTAAYFGGKSCGIEILTYHKASRGGSCLMYES